MNKTDTETLICQSLLDLMESKRYPDIKVTELVKHANISRSSFYIHFDAIEDVLQKIEDDIISEFPDENSKLIQKIKGGDPDGLLESLLYIKKNMRKFRILIGEYGDPYFQIRIGNRTSRLLYSSLASANTKLTTTQLKLICENVSSGRWGMYKWWIFHEDEVTLNDIIEMTQKIMRQIADLI
jgi:Transcriptional regulator